MGLELALGRPVGPMMEKSLALWHRYARTIGLPWRRLEHAIALGAMRIAESISGSEGKTIEDFLLPDELFVAPNCDHEINEVWDAFGLTAEERERVTNG